MNGDWTCKQLVPVLILMFSTGCATISGGDGSSSTALERSFKKCGIAIGGGALVGGVIAKLLDKDVGGGALVGVGLGGAACAVLYALEAREDRERLSQIQQTAAAQGQSRRDQFQTEKGQTATVDTRVSEAKVKGKRYSVCRYVDQTAQVDGQQANIEPQLWCRVAKTGNWEAATSSA